MDAIYVCHFSNGHIKVGRSIDPVARIAAHADRVACVGIELVNHFIAECQHGAAHPERLLIERCADNAIARNKNEWFVGLGFQEVCAWATEFCIAKQEPRQRNAQMEAIDYVEAIRAHGLTQSQITEKTGIPQPTISKIERGEVSDVMSKNYRALQTLYEELSAQKGQAPAQQGA